jgi:hypothetical protein
MNQLNQLDKTSALFDSVMNKLTDLRMAREIKLGHDSSLNAPEHVRFDRERRFYVAQFDKVFKESQQYCTTKEYKAHLKLRNKLDFIQRREFSQLRKQLADSLDVSGYIVLFKK